MIPMRLRITELMKRQKIRPTAYALAQASKGAINHTTALRLLNKPARVDMKTLETLCTVLKCEPSELLARD